MAISELQLGLMGIGVAAVVAVVAYNKWQEGRHRRRTEQAFGGKQPDVLLEPGLREPEGGEAGASSDGEPDEALARPVREQSGRRGSPGDPPGSSELADCVVRVESIEALAAGRLWRAAGEAIGELGKPLRWFAFDDGENAWIEIDRNSAGEHHWFAAVLQLVDRRGPLGETELVRFFTGLQRVADQFLAVPAAVPQRGEVLRRAGELDSFCASIDVQIGLNVVAGEQDFPGTKLRGLAEAQGWVLCDDGSYHAGDADGEPLFTVSNQEGQPFAAADMRKLQTRGITLLLDVPCTRNGVIAFERMLSSARQIADSLRGEVVDDNRVPFGDTEAHVIRGQIQQFQQRMKERGLEPGGEVARRLFST